MAKGGNTDAFLYFLIKKGLSWAARIPRWLLTGAAVPLARIWYGLDRYHRGIATNNI